MTKLEISGDEAYAGVGLKIRPKFPSPLLFFNYLKCAEYDLR